MATIQGYNLPDDLYYHKEHSWAKKEGDTIRVGMTEFFAKSAGDIVYVDLPFEGDSIEKDQTCGKVQSSKWIGKLIAPVGGEIVAVNQDLEGESTLINTDPYGKGWIMVVKPANADADLAGLMHAPADVAAWIAAEVARVEQEKKK
jgi:glycine cleavage system H protein